MSEEKIMEYILKIIGVGGSISAVIYYSLKYLFKKIVDNKFEESLSVYRHKLSLDFENYKYKLNSDFNRITKIQEREFEVLSEAWKKLQDAYNGLIYLMTPYQFFATIVEAENPKENNSEEQKKNAFWKDYDLVYRKLTEFQDYIRKNKIFMEKELFDLFSTVEKIMDDAHLNTEDYSCNKVNYKPYTIIKEIQQQVLPVVAQIEKIIQNKLQFNKA